MTIRKLAGRAAILALSTLLLTAAALLWAWGGFIALKVFDDYKDSTDAAYLMLGSLLALVGTVLAGAALLLLWPNRYSSLTLGALALVAGLMPYWWLFGPAGVLVNALLLVIATTALVLGRRSYGRAAR
jgi:hypothetical protein